MHSVLRPLEVWPWWQPVYYDSMNPRIILTRVAASHLRVGHLPICSGINKVEDLRTLADYALKRHYPEAEYSYNHYLALH